MTTLTLNPATRHELKIFGLLAAVFAAVYFLPVGTPRFDGAVSEALELTKWYAREHVVLCLLPAFWIAGAIAAFVSQASVMRFLGPDGAEAARVRCRIGLRNHPRRVLVARCCRCSPASTGWAQASVRRPHSCTPGPAINVLAIVMTAKVLGVQLGLARAAGAVGVQRGHRLADGVDFPPRGTAEGRRRSCVA